MKTILVRFMTTVLSALLVVGVAIPSHALTQDEANLMCALFGCTSEQKTRVNALVTTGVGSSSTSSCYNFTRDMSVGSRGADVTALQDYLKGTGHFTFGNSTGYFGPVTQTAVSAWQRANSVSPSAGYFGALSRAKHKNVCTTTTKPSIPPTSKPSKDTSKDGDDSFFSGTNEGYLNDFDQLSKYSAEQVGERQKDIPVLGVEFAALGSDQMLERVTVEVDSPTGEDDLDDFIEDVSVWVDGKMISRMAVDKASRNRKIDKYTFRFINLKKTLKRAKTVEMTIRVTGTKKLGSAEEGDGWTITIPANGIRAASPNGVTDEYDNTAFSETFIVESFAAASGAELRVGLSDKSPEARVVNVNNTKDTNNVVLLVGTLEAKGSDIEIFELPVLLTAVGANVNQIANRLILKVDGDKFSKPISTATTVATIVFDKVHIKLDKGDKVEFSVLADINDLEGVFGEGDTLRADITATEVDAIEAEDESGEDLDASDLTGSALGKTASFYDKGIFVSFVSASASAQVESGADNDTGVFTIVFRVEAFDDTVYVSNSAVATTADTIEAETVSPSGILYQVQRSGVATIDNLSSDIDFVSKSGTVTSSTNGFRLDEGEVAEFTLTVARRNDSTGDNGFYRALLKSVGWNTNDSTTFNVYNFDLGDYKSRVVLLN